MRSMPSIRPIFTHAFPLAVAVLATLSALAAGVTATADGRIDVSSQTPDISQKGLPNANYCAPCAAANVLYQFDSRGSIALPDAFGMRGGETESQAGGRLAELLGDASHMQTRDRNGTNRYRLVDGLGAFSRDRLGMRLEIKYLGIRAYDLHRVAADIRPGVRATEGIPTLEHLQQAMLRGDGVIILFGSYRRDGRKPGRMNRIGGHYVAAVGFGENADGEECSRCIVLHDSNDRHSGKKVVVARRVGHPLELHDGDTRLIRASELVELVGAPIRKDGRVAYLETIFSISFASP